jgi:hypothetical protein
MDPVTAALNTLNTLLQIGMKVYDDTPVAIRQAEAANWGQFVVNIGNQILALQNKLTSLITDTTVTVSGSTK